MKDLSDCLQVIEAAIREALAELRPKTEPLLYDAIEYAVCGGGKRVRPVLMLLSADTLGLPAARVVRLAAALELIHTYSLIHDDLPCMDNDDYRRGRLTVHKVYGEGLAVLAGDALLNYAYEIILDACAKDSDLTLAGLELAKAAGFAGMVGGQAADITRTEYTKEELLYMYSQKTGALIQAAISVPYIIYKSDKLALAQELGGKVGLVFQLADDIIDAATGEDALKKTYTGLMGKKKTLDKIEKLYGRCVEIIKILNIDKSLLHEYTATLCHRLK